MLLKSGVYHGIATHDEAIIDQTKEFAVREKISPKSFEFQMLYGIRRDLQEQLVKDGWGMRVYVPFGPSGTRTSCADWQSVRQTPSSSQKTC